MYMAYSNRQGGGESGVQTPENSGDLFVLDCLDKLPSCIDQYQDSEFEDLLHKINFKEKTEARKALLEIIIYGKKSLPIGERKRLYDQIYKRVLKHCEEDSHATIEEKEHATNKFIMKLLGTRNKVGYFYDVKDQTAFITLRMWFEGLFPNTYNFSARLEKRKQKLITYFD